MQLIDEKKDIAVRLGDFGKHRLQTFLKLAAVLRARDERAHIQGEERLVLQGLRHVALDDTLREPFGDRRFADARLADEHGVVLRLTRKDAHDVADLFIAPDDGLELVLAGALCEIGAVFFQRLVGLLGVVARHVLIAAHLLHSLKKLVLGDAEAPEQLFEPLFIVIEQAQEEVFDGDVFILHAVRELLRLVQQSAHRRRGVRLTAPRRARKPLDGVLNGGGKSVCVRTRAFEDTEHQPVALHERIGDMQRGEFGVAVLDCGALRALDRLQRFLREFVCVHTRSPSERRPRSCVFRTSVTIIPQNHAL